MTSKQKVQEAAQNQHYVPKLILRNFLSNDLKEQVTVFDKKSGKIFRPNITGIMAERRFHDFQISQEYLMSFEETAGRFENAVLPTYHRILKERRLTHSPKEQADLALLVAFQFLRTRAQRDRFVEMDEMIDAKLKSQGGSIQDLEGWTPLTEDRLKRQHALFIVETIKDFAKILVEKHFLLISSPPNRDFYLSDNPVTLHNDEDFGLRGNIGFAVRGIQIYLPLSHNLMLCCICSTILNEALKEIEDHLDQVRKSLLSLVISGKITGEQMRAQIQVAQDKVSLTLEWRKSYIDGVPQSATHENMDFYNSLQMSQSRQFVISKNEDFSLARRFVAEFPDHKGGGMRIA